MKSSHHNLAALSILAGASFFAGEAEAANVVVNGSFETGTAGATNPADVAGWTGVNRLYSHPYNGISGIKLADAGGAQSTVATGNYNFNSVAYGVNNTIVGGIGRQFFGLASNGGLVPTQIITTAALSVGASSSVIDSGGAAYSFSGWLASWSGDANTPALSATFFDADNASGTAISTVTFDRGSIANQVTTAQFLATGSNINGADTATTDPDYWALYEFQSFVPAGTRSISLTIVAGTGHAANGSNDWYVENVVLDVVPEPSATLLAGLGAFALLRRRRD